jgi:hypothetical protein
MSTEIPLKLPKLVFVDDYHEFGHIEDMLRELVGNTKVKVLEVSTGLRDHSYNQYIGIVYTKKDDPDYKRLVKEAEEWEKRE